MIALHTTTMKLQAVLASAANTTQPVFHVWYKDVPAQVKEGNEDYQIVLQRTVLNDTTNVDICDAPPVVGTKRHIVAAACVNRSLDTEVITVSTYDGTNRYPVYPKTVATNGFFGYEAERGWYPDDASSSSGSGFPFSVQLTENNLIMLDAVLSADGTASGIGLSGTLGETAAFGDCVYLKTDAKWWLAKANAAATSALVMLGMVVDAGGADATSRILLWGNIRADSKFPTFVVGGSVIISGTTAGALLGSGSIPLTTTDYVTRIVGEAPTADSLFFHPSNDYDTHV